MRLIDADKWGEYYSCERNTVPTSNDYDAGQNDALDSVDRWMDEQTTVDAVEVVRCKDCKDARKEIATDNGEYFMCKHTETIHSGNHFCSYGERG